MADTIVEVDIGIAGITGATIKLYPQGSDSIANGAGDSLTAETNRTGTYRATVTEALDGIYQAYVFDSNGVEFFNGLVDMADDAAVHHVEEHAALASVCTEARLARLDAAITTRAAASVLGTPAGASIAADVAAILTTALTESYAADGAEGTAAQLLYMIQQSLHEFAISSTTRTVKKLDGSTTAATFTLDDATAPTSTTRAT